MKNHEFIDNIATKILRYNNKIYISDIREIIKREIYGDKINYELEEIIKKLDNNILKDFNIFMNMNNYNYNESELKNNIKYHLFRIYNNYKGKECLLKLVNDE
jgi:hypothetical protein